MFCLVQIKIVSKTFKYWFLREKCIKCLGKNYLQGWTKFWIVQVYKAALQRDPRNPDLYYNLGVVAIEEKQPEKGQLEQSND